MVSHVPHLSMLINQKETAAINMKPKPKGTGKIIVASILILILILGAVTGISLFIKGKKAPSSDGNQSSSEISSQTSSEFGQGNDVLQEKDPDKDDSDSSGTNDQQNTDPDKDNNDDKSNSQSQEGNTPTGGEGNDKQDSTETQSGQEGNAQQPAVTQPQQESISVEKIWNGMRSSMGENLTANLSLSKENLTELYGLDPAVCESFIFRKSGTVVSPEEYLIVKGTESNLSIVEQACQQRQAALAVQWEKMGKDYTNMIASYQIVRSGNYLFFGISPNISQMVGLFQGMMLSAN